MVIFPSSRAATAAYAISDDKCLLPAHFDTKSEAGQFTIPEFISSGPVDGGINRSFREPYSLGHSRCDFLGVHLGSTIWEISEYHITLGVTEMIIK